MASAVGRFLALSFVVLTAASAALLHSAFADPRVGVTSATSGDPRGKPPAEAERVLHVGVDVQANEVVSTGAADRAHLLFLDGSSLTVGPQARLTIDRFVYDPNGKANALAVTASQGVFRFVGGKISKTQPVIVTTPSATLTIRGGIMLFKVEPNRTTATFMHGVEMTMTAKGITQIVNRPGWQIVTVAGFVPGKPVPVPPGGLAPEMQQLEALQPQPGGGDPDAAAKNSGFTDKNSGLGPQGGTPIPDAGTVGTANNAVNDVNTQLQRPFVPVPMSPPPPVVVPPTGGCGLRCF